MKQFSGRARGYEKDIPRIIIAKASKLVLFME
jgi:hypothetical protein